MAVVEHVIEGVVGQHVALADNPHQVLGVLSRLLRLLLVRVQVLAVDEESRLDPVLLQGVQDFGSALPGPVVKGQVDDGGAFHLDLARLLDGELAVRGLGPIALVGGCVIGTGN